MPSEFDARVANGQCGSCGKPNSNHLSTCDECRAKQKETSAARRDYRRKNNICQQGDHPSIPGEALCALHKAKAAEVQRKRREQRIADAECEGCGGKHGKKLPDSSRCRYCLDRQNEAGKAVYAQRKEAHICIKCPKPATNGIYCEEHKKEDAEKKAAERAACVAANICTRCKKNPMPPDGRRCEECRKRSRGESAAQRQKWADQNKCHGCGGEQKEGCVLCQDCISELSVASSAAYRRRIESNTCGYCTRPPVPGLHYCEYHRKQASDRNFALKIETFEAYGGVVCSGCLDVFDPDVLELHHVFHDGAEDRRNRKSQGGTDFYQKLKNDGYPTPERYRVICSRCNTKAEQARRRGDPDPFTGVIIRDVEKEKIHQDHAQAS